MFTNLALDQPAEQEDDYDANDYKATASRAVDGNRDGRWRFNIYIHIAYTKIEIINC